MEINEFKKLDVETQKSIVDQMLDDWESCRIMDAKDQLTSAQEDLILARENE